MAMLPVWIHFVYKVTHHFFALIRIIAELMIDSW